MELPYWIFLVIYGIAFVFYIAFMLVNVYHMIRFGFFDFVARIHATLVFGVMGAILVSTALLLIRTPWGDTFPVWPSAIDNTSTLLNSLPF